MSLFVLFFSLSLIFCGMFSSFIASLAIKNALFKCFIATSVVTAMFTFEYYETVALIIAVELLFTSLLVYNHTDPIEIVYNQLVSIILLGGFYLVSGYYYSVKANYYMQLIEVKEKNIEIEKASEFKNRVLGMVAHDLRNPIAAVESIAMLIEMDTDDDETRENLDLIKSACGKARSIINELLEASRENNNMFVTEKTDINIFLENFVAERTVQNGHKEQIELKSYDKAAFARINTERFQRVFDNLVDNAVKFSKDKIELLLYKNDANVIVEVKDYGIGIPGDTLPIIFDPFTRAGRTGLKGEQSTGLGLSIVKQIVEKHKGIIEVESEEGKGSLFRIRLPEA